MEKLVTSNTFSRIRSERGARGLQLYGQGVADATWGAEYAKDTAELDRAEAVLARRKTPEARALFDARVRSLSQKWEIPDEDRWCLEQDMQRLETTEQSEQKESTRSVPEEDIREFLSDVDQVVARRWKQDPTIDPLTQGGGDGVSDDNLDVWVDSLFRPGEGFFFRDHNPSCTCQLCHKARQILERRKERPDLEDDGFIFTTSIIPDDASVKYGVVGGGLDEWDTVAEQRFANPEGELTPPDPATENTQTIIENPDRLLTDSSRIAPQNIFDYSAQMKPPELKDER